MGCADLPAVFAKRSQVLQVLGALSHKVGPGLRKHMTFAFLPGSNVLEPVPLTSIPQGHELAFKYLLGSQGEVTATQGRK